MSSYYQTSSTHLALNCSIQGLSERVEILNAFGTSSNLIVDYSLPHNRLRQFPDGSIELIPKSVGEVIGESAVRPLMEGTFHLAGQGYNILKDYLTRIDKAVGRVFNIFPGASAQNFMPATNGLSTFRFQTSHLDFETHYMGLSAENQNKLMQINEKFADNYKKIQGEKKNLALFFNKLADHYEEYHVELDKYSDSLYTLQNKINEILQSVQKKMNNSEYGLAGANNQELVLIFPEFTIIPCPEDMPVEIAVSVPKSLFGMALI